MNRNAYFTDHTPRKKLDKETVRVLLLEMALGTTKFTAQEAQDIKVCGYNYLSALDQNVVRLASARFYEEKDMTQYNRKGKLGKFVNKRRDKCDPNDAKLILQFL